MRHGKAHRKFNRTPSHRRAMFRNMATSLFEHERLETTIQKAKDLRPVAEKLITLAGEDNLHRRRQAYSYLQNKATVHKLFAEIGPRFKERPGGYTRVVRSRFRAGDAAELAIIELVSDEFAGANPKKNKKKAEVLPLAENVKAVETEEAAQAETGAAEGETTEE